MTTPTPSYQSEGSISETDILADFQSLLTSSPSVFSAPSSVPSVIPPPMRDTIDTQKQGAVNGILWDVKHSLTPFANWLRLQKLSRVSIKNYLSDLRHFLNWLAQNRCHCEGPRLTRDRGNLNGDCFVTTRNDTSLCDITPEIVQDYIRQLKAPRATINRRLASVRKFSIFLGQTISIPTIPQDPTQTLLKSFRAHLIKKRHSPKTITNYLSDLRHYLTWATKSTPPSPSLVKRGT